MRIERSHSSTAGSSSTLAWPENVSRVFSTRIANAGVVADVNFKAEIAAEHLGTANGLGPSPNNLSEMASDASREIGVVVIVALLLVVPALNDGAKVLEHAWCTPCNVFAHLTMDQPK